MAINSNGHHFIKTENQRVLSYAHIDVCMAVEERPFGSLFQSTRWLVVTETWLEIIRTFGTCARRIQSQTISPMNIHVSRLVCDTNDAHVQIVHIVGNGRQLRRMLL